MEEAASAWREVAAVRRVEHVLTPVCVSIVMVSNLALLAHESRVAWRSRRLIPPKLLVMALAATDLIATVFGYLPLWIFFEISQPSTMRVSAGGDLQSFSTDTDVPPVSKPPSLSPALEITTNKADVSPMSSVGSPPVVHTLGYAVTLFLLAAFWTLAQCIVVVMGVERFLALRAPFFYTARCSCSAFLGVLVVLLILSCGVGVFHLLVHMAEMTTQPPAFAGFLESGSLPYNVYTLVQGVVWTVVLLLCNWGVTRELQRMEESVTVMRLKEESEYLKQLSMVHGAGRDFARFMMAVNVLFLLSACPNLVCITLILCRRAPSFSMQYFCWRMSHISAMLNPFLYGFLRKSLRSRIRRFLNQHIPCLRPQRVGQQTPGPVLRYQNNQLAPSHTGRSANFTMRDPEASRSTVHLSD